MELAALLKDAAPIKELKLGTDALVQDVTIEGSTIDLTIHEGKVTRQENGALAKALQGLLTK